MIPEDKFPKWLQWLLGEKGDSPLLSVAAVEFLAEIWSRIVKEATSKGSSDGCPPDENGNSLNHKLSRMEDNFEKVVEHLKKHPQPRSKFLEHYPDWRFFRRTNIAELSEIAKSVEKAEKRFLIARLVGSSVSLLGGALSLVAGHNKGLFSDVLRELGTATSAGTSVCEVGFLQLKIQKAEKIIKHDKEHSKELWSWLSDGTFLEEALQDIMRVDVAKDLKLAAEELTNIFYNRKNRSRSVLEKEIMTVLESFSVREVHAEEIADVVGILMAVHMLYENLRPLFNLTLELCKSSVKFYNLIRVALSCLTCLAAEGRSKNFEKGRRTKKEVLRLGFGMVMDGIDIALVKKALESDENEVAKWISEAAGELRKELELFEKVERAINEGG